ncbi:MAG: dihydrolipoyl dehydrogenase [Oligoflexia bacterium]|nr:dihydrolipoyl dehydrogenase [Oligoflexia bacterium]
MAAEQFDLIVVGSGPAGYTGAIRASQLGMKVACVEKDKTYGGTCLNVGCIPSKALLESSEHYLQAKTKFAKHGIVLGSIQLDLPSMIKRKEGVVRQLTTGIAGLFKKNKIEGVAGLGTFKGRAGDQIQIEVDNAGTKRLIQAPKVMIATGSTPAQLPFMPFDGDRVVSSTEALCFSEVPKHLVVVGGGVIGLELGSVWARLGARVTVIEFADRICSTVDQQIGKELYKALQKQGMEFRLATKCLGATRKGDVMIVQTEEIATGTKSQIECDRVLVATGRKPNTQGLGLDAIGLATDKLGRLEIDSHYQTKAPGVYAVGDVVAGPMLAHKAEEEGVAVVEIMAGQAGHVNYDAIPNVIYTWPEVASVGMTEEEVKAKGIAYKIGTFPFMANGRAKSMDETEGLAKIIADAQTDRVLGVHIVGPRASDMIPEAVATMEFGGSAEDIARTCHAHPTLSEVLKQAALGVDKRTIEM